METSHRVLYIYHGYFLFQSVMQYPCCHLTYFSKNSIARPKVYTTEKQVVARLVRNDQTIHIICIQSLHIPEGLIKILTFPILIILLKTRQS